MTEQAKPAGTATLTYGDKTVDLPILKGTTGPDVVDIRKLYAATDVFTYDPGFTSTASCESKITYHRRRRGRPAAPRLSDRPAGREVELPRGLLPAAARRTADRRRVRRVRAQHHHHTMLHAQFDRFFEGFRRDAHPMAIMVGAVGALSAFYHDSINIDDPRAARDLGPPPDRQDADHRGARLQILASASRSCRRATTSPTPRTSCACASPCRPRTGGRIRS